MSLIIDLVVVGLIALFVFIGIKRGFVKEIVSLVGFIVALVLAFSLSNVGAELAYDNFIDASVQDSVKQSITDSVKNDANGILNSVPEEFISAAKTIGIDIEAAVNDSIGVNISDTAQNVALKISHDIARPVVTTLIRVILFLVLFIIIRILIGWLGKVLNIFARLPVLHSANKLLGGIVGFLRGTVIALVLCYVVILIVNVRENGLIGITKETIEASNIVNFVAEMIK